MKTLTLKEVVERLEQLSELLLRLGFTKLDRIRQQIKAVKALDQALQDRDSGKVGKNLSPEETTSLGWGILELLASGDT